MAKLPDFCPHCHALVGSGATEYCAMCGQKLIGEQTDDTQPYLRDAHHAGPRTRSWRTIALVAGIAMVVCIFAAAALTLNSSDHARDNTTVHKSTSVKPTTTSTSVDATTVSSRVQSLFLASGDFDSKWKQMDPVEFAPESHLADTCWPTDPLMSSISIAESDYSYNLQSNSAEGARLYYTVHMAKSADVQSEQMARYAGASQTCAKDQANAFFTQGGAQIKKESVATVKRTLPVTYVDFRWSATTKMGSTTSHPTSEFLVLQGGPAHTLLEFDDCGCKLGPPPDQDAIINHAVALLQAQAGDQP